MCVISAASKAPAPLLALTWGGTASEGSLHVAPATKRCRSVAGLRPSFGRRCGAGFRPDPRSSCRAKSGDRGPEGGNLSSFGKPPASTPGRAGRTAASPPPALSPQNRVFGNARALLLGDFVSGGCRADPFAPSASAPPLHPKPGLGWKRCPRRGVPLGGGGTRSGVPPPRPPTCPGAACWLPELIKY